jgi:feruloyl esterase
MMFAQRYPTDFDGIAVCAPAMSVSSGATIAAAWDTQTYFSAAPADANGQRVLSRAFSDADLALVARGITAACDAADGAADGMVLRPEACRFDPKTLLCAGAKEDATNCLTSDQVAALERAFGGPRTSSGRALYVGQAWDPGIAAPGWRQWKLGSSQTGTPNSANTTLMAGALAYEFVTPPDPSLAITRFDFDRDPERMQAFSQVYDTYRDATLAGFHARGGKLLIFHGTADPIFSALESIDYYQRLTRNNGGPDATARWARLFLVPGMNHCAGGPATDSFDGLAAIVDWVEKAPPRLASRRRRVPARRISRGGRARSARIRHTPAYRQRKPGGRRELHVRGTVRLNGNFGDRRLTASTAAAPSARSAPYQIPQHGRHVGLVRMLLARRAQLRGPRAIMRGRTRYGSSSRPSRRRRRAFAIVR